MNAIAVIMRLTFREAIRRRIVLAAIILGIAFLIIFDLGFYFINADVQNDLGRSGRQAATVQNEIYNFMLLAGMYVINFLGIATAALITADSLAGEISTGTIQAIVTKPIYRSQVVLGKWLGNALLLLLYLCMMGGGTILSIWLMVGYLAPNWAGSVAMLYFNSLLIMSLTLALSSSLSTLATGGAVFGAYGVAFIGGWVERIGTVLSNQTAMDIGVLTSLLLPSEAIYNKASSLMTSRLASMVEASPFSAPREPSLLMMVYAGFYLAMLVVIAIRNFRRRDL